MSCSTGRSEMAVIASCLRGEDGEYGFAGVLRGPAPAGGARLNEMEAAPVLGILAGVALDRREGRGVGDDDSDRAGVFFQAHQLEADGLSIGVYHGVADEFGG